MLLDGKKFLQTDAVNSLISASKEARLKIGTFYTNRFSYMDYEGLKKVYDIISKQQGLECTGTYIQVTKVTCALDNSIIVGQGVTASGRNGIVTNVTHTVDLDSAITTFTMKSIIG
jgi:hypothetical protein